MIVVFHHHNKVHSIFDHEGQELIAINETHVLKTMMQLASMFDNRILVWCRLDSKDLLNYEAITDVFKIKNVMVSYGNGAYIPNKIGYVESSPFINVNTTVKYSTWLMHSTVGAIYSSTLLKFKNFSFSNDFEYDLNSIAKLGMSKGLFCYSDPKLLSKSVVFLVKSAGVSTLFRFVKQHYKTRWVFLLALNFLWHERKLKLLPLLKSLFYKKRHFNAVIPLESIVDEPILKLPSIDVIIPTIGRTIYLHDVLKDLAKQTHLPYQVIIVEQNPDNESSSDLDFIYSETWPFKIDHRFIHQTGACNARNLALKQVVSKFVFLADDDIRFKSDIIEKALNTMKNPCLEAATLSCLKEDEREIIKTPIQWFAFGSGCSIVNTKLAKEVSFDMSFEFGFGEDSDFGMQLRNLGCDITYLPRVKILHLKAPFGGFRTIHTQKWTNDSIQPKPSPTVMLYNLKHKSEEQIKGYKTLLFLKFYKKQAIKNPMAYIEHTKVRWERSKYWAEQLMHKTD